MLYPHGMTDLDVSDAARAFRVSERTIRRWLHDGRLAGYRVGGRIRIPERAIREAAAPYGDEVPVGSEKGGPAPAHPGAIAELLADPGRLRGRREAAARAMDVIAAASRPAATLADTAEELVRAIRNEAEAKSEQ